MDLGYATIYVDVVTTAVEFDEQAFGVPREFAQMSTGDTEPATTSHELGAVAAPIPHTAHDTSWRQTVSYVRESIGTLIGNASPIGV